MRPNPQETADFVTFIEVILNVNFNFCVLQKILIEQRYGIEQQQKIYHICLFSEDDEILVKKAEMETYNEEETELLMRVVKEIRYAAGRIPPNLKYIDRKKVKAATVKIIKIEYLIKTERIAETNSVLRAAGNIVAEMVGYKNKEMTEDRQPNWQRRILGKQEVLRKELGEIEQDEGDCKMKT